MRDGTLSSCLRSAMASASCCRTRRSTTGEALIEPLTAFAEQWTGELILVASRASLAGELAKFDFSWFIPSLVKYRRLLGEVLLISFFLQLFALVSPLFFQVVMDKVLVHRGLTTLDVLVIGLVVVVVFESVLTALRTYVFSHTTSRIDVELGARLFRHLVQLPLAYFQARRVGDSVARVRELENIRSFLTGNALTVLLDVLFSVIFIARDAVLQRAADADRAGEPAVVRLAEPGGRAGPARAPEREVRPRRREPGDAGGDGHRHPDRQGQRAGAAARPPLGQPARGLRLGELSHADLASWAHEGINLIGKVVNAATLWYGAQLVMNNELTVGQFVAFNMFAQRVAQPIMRMAQLWTDFQQTGISMARLGDILNTRTEVPPSTAAQLPPLRGRVTLDNVTFRYRPEAAPVLHGVSLDVRPAR